jgi:hypothetical protein
MPQMSRGAEQLTDVLVYLTLAEARELKDALQNRLDEREGFCGPAYHLRIEAEGRELTVGVFDY